MEFKQATGIVAWADSLPYETFAGPDVAIFGRFISVGASS
jgi:hypothetical protein